MTTRAINKIASSLDEAAARVSLGERVATQRSHFQVRTLGDGAYVEITRIVSSDTGVGALPVALLTPEAALALAQQISDAAYRAQWRRQ